MPDQQCEPDKKVQKREPFSEENMASFCKALGHPARIRLVRILIEKGECISGDLA